jgi:hypothetical protein
MRTYHSQDLDAVSKLNSSLRDLRVQLVNNLARNDEIDDKDKLMSAAGLDIDMRRRYKEAMLLQAQQMLGVDDDRAAKLVAAGMGSGLSTNNIQVTVVRPGELAYTILDKDGNPKPIMLNPEDGSEGPRIGVVNADSIQGLIDMAGNPGLYGAEGRQEYEEFVSTRNSRDSASARQDEQLELNKNADERSEADESRKDRRITNEEERLRIQEGYYKSLANKDKVTAAEAQEVPATIEAFMDEMALGDPDSIHTVLAQKFREATETRPNWRQAIAQAVMLSGVTDPATLMDNFVRKAAGTPAPAAG